MTHGAVYNTIRAQFATVASAATVTVIYDNQANQDTPDTGIWCRLTILPGDEHQIAMGVDRFRMVGVMVAQLFGPLGEGDGNLLTLADTIMGNFRNDTYSGVRFKVPSMINMGQRNSNWQINVNCPFAAEYTTT